MKFYNQLKIILSILILLFSYQNCSPSSTELGQVNSEVENQLLTLSDDTTIRNHGNGDGYAGKLSYYKFDEDSLCKGKIKMEGFDIHSQIDRIAGVSYLVIRNCTFIEPEELPVEDVLVSGDLNTLEYEGQIYQTYYHYQLGSQGKADESRLPLVTVQMETNQNNVTRVAVQKDAPAQTTDTSTQIANTPVKIDYLDIFRYCSALPLAVIVNNQGPIKNATTPGELLFTPMALAKSIKFTVYGPGMKPICILNDTPSLRAQIMNDKRIDFSSCPTDIHSTDHIGLELDGYDPYGPYVKALRMDILNKDSVLFSIKNEFGYRYRNIRNYRALPIPIADDPNSTNWVDLSGHISAEAYAKCD